ncbi:hypothetical protein [Nocardia sp. Marseille-Q1738]
MVVHPLTTKIESVSTTAGRSSTQVASEIGPGGEQSFLTITAGVVVA